MLCLDFTQERVSCGGVTCLRTRWCAQSQRCRHLLVADPFGEVFFVCQNSVLLLRE